MFTRFKRNIKTLFLDPNFKGELEYESGTKVNVILSPTLYWVKKLSLPISSIREVKKLLPSIFEDTLMDSHYSYTAYKVGDEFIAFAYEDKKIFDFLKKLGINYSDVASLRFAQSEFDSLESAVSVNETQSMYLKESLLVLAPTAWFSETEVLNTEDIKLSKHTITLHQFGHIVDNKSLYKIGGVLVILALILIVEIFVSSAKKSEIVDAKDALFSKYKLQPTMFQNNASMKKYTKIHKTQTKLREYISYFLGMKLKASQKITLIEYKNSTLYVSFSGVAKGSERKITSQLDSQKVNYKLTFNGENMKVEMKL